MRIKKAGPKQKDKQEIRSKKGGNGRKEARFSKSDSAQKPQLKTGKISIPKSLGRNVHTKVLHTHAHQLTPQTDSCIPTKKKQHRKELLKREEVNRLTKEITGITERKQPRRNYAHTIEMQSKAKQSRVRQDKAKHNG